MVWEWDIPLTDAYLESIDAFIHNLEESPFMPLSIKRILDNLLFLRAFLIHPREDIFGDGWFRIVQTVGRKIASIVSSIDLRDMDSEDIHNMETQLADALWPVLNWISTARGYYYLGNKNKKPPRHYYPRTAQLVFIYHLVENLQALLAKCKPHYLIGPLKHYILQLRQKLLFLSYRLKEIPQSRRQEADMMELVKRVGNLAYEAEYAFDLYRLGHIPIWSCMFWLGDIQKELIHGWKQIKTDSGDIESILSCILNTEPIELQIVPIINHNIELSVKRAKVFNHPAVIDAFSIRTCCSFASSFKGRKTVFPELLQNVSYAPYVEEDDREKVDLESDLSKDDLQRSLYNLLENSRYLIRLEDVPDINALNGITDVLPKNGFGCRILLTTPSPELVLQCHYDSRKIPVEPAAKSQADKLPIYTDVVGFKAESKEMLDLLLRGPTKLHVISVFGMPGQGKTTLGKKLFSDWFVINYFDTRAWCYVSQVYKKKELLLELLGQLVQHFDTISEKNDEDLAEMLYKHLEGQRFLIVFDDVWKIDAWNDLKRCFPNDNIGSRIIFTTRMQELASQVTSDHTLQPVCPLSEHESWELLKNKVFQNKDCPPELLEVGKQIAKDCRGLPLSVILTAGILAKMEREVDQWQHIGKTLSSCILSDAKAQAKGIIELSYMNLSDSLKPCFLYFGAFLDREVPVRKLFFLWIAEGFIQCTDKNRLEDEAQDYLKDLIGRSLVTVVQEKSDRGVKSCRVHDLLREFCLMKAGEENFLQQINGNDEHFSSSNNNRDYGVDPTYSYSSKPIIYEKRRLSIYCKRNHFTMLKPSGPLVRSLMFFASADMSPAYSYGIPFLFHSFSLLKILDLEDINIGDSFLAVEFLILLRYLAIQCSMDFVPPSIAGLFDLETFLYKRSSGKVVKVPNCLWDMQKLRHVHINDNASFDLESYRAESSSILENLQTFSTPSLAYGDNMEKVLRKLRGIRKLKCIFLDSWDEASNCNKFPKLEFLSQLVSLNVLYEGMGKYPCEFNFPSNLKKLTLSSFRMPWDEISQLTKLSNLEILKLLCSAFEGERWQMEDEVFSNLKFLKLDALNIVEWSAFDYHFPRLERLVLHNCNQLSEIPSGVGEILTLQKIEVIWCNSSVAISAKRIQEDQVEFGNEALKIHVHPKMPDSESSV